MQLSKRITGLNDGPDGWEILSRARAMQAAGRDIVQLSVGEHAEGTPNDILQAMHAAALAGETGYAPVPGLPALRAAIARRVSTRTGVPTGPENVLVTPGGQAALFAAHMAALDPGDRALFIDPYYATYPGTIRAAGGLPVAIAASPADGFLPDPARLAAAPAARTLLINSPNNPTGAVYDAGTLEALAALCRDRAMWLISDEVYDTQVWEGRHFSPRAMPGMAERSFVIGSLSKGHAMTGSRIGWLIGPAEAIAHLVELATSTTYGVPGYIQRAALHALAAGPALEQRIAEPFRRRRQLAHQVLAGQNLVRPVASAGAMYLMVDITATGHSGRDFANRLLDEAAVAVMPGESFGAAAAGHVRIAMSADDDVFAAALHRLVDLAKGLSP